MLKEIRGFFGLNRWLSNFWPARVQYEGDWYGSVENAYQAAKCLHRQDRARFKGVSPGQAKRLSHQMEIRTDWNQVKLGIMAHLIRQKFSHNSSLQKKLIETDGDTELQVRI